MAKLIPAVERMARAQALIEKARALPAPSGAGMVDLDYAAQVKDLLRQARDLIKFINYTPSATAEMKEQIRRIFTDADQAEHDLLRRSSSNL